MQLNIKYANEQIEKIRDQGIFYACACPSQVGAQIASLRHLFNYQNKCIANENEDVILSKKTHELIAEATNKAHDIMQNCLHDVLINEGWNLDTLDMPDNLRDFLIEASQKD